ncbi:DUF551 domain-containing protein [Escherichia coli]|nr:DUF551 domain-containing protein [Escherichia coli]TEV94275.1 DUF551 domain-containing protein [Escherichia coli]
MAEFTKEQLIEELERRLAVTTHYPDFEEAQLDAQIFKIALEALTAGMEQEPVAWLLSGGGAKNNVSFDSGNAYADPLREVTPLYTAPPAPVVPEEATPENVEMLSGYVSTYKLTDSERDIAAEIWNACRAAMLQAEPVSNSDELPLDYLQGHKDGLEWAAQLAEANHPQTGDWLYDDPIDLARAIRKGPDMPTVQGGNSPVTPDGWISCSEQMPEMGERQCYVLAADFKNNYPPNIPNTQVGVYGDWFNDGNPTWDDGDGEDLYLKEVTHWMQLPEPPQEAK